MTKTETSRTETSDRTAVLVLTVGTGDMSDMNRLEESLFRPLEKSLRDGRFRLAVLLPSQSTMGNAQQFKDRIEQRMHGFDIRIEPLPEAGWENDADACFGHFDHVLNQLKQCHGPEAIVPDFTRGTKAMSAALVLAAIRHDLPKLRYIDSDRRDSRGMVVAGTETRGFAAPGHDAPPPRRGGAIDGQRCVRRRVGTLTQYRRFGFAAAGKPGAERVPGSGG